jgi:hypothetical protein
MASNINPNSIDGSYPVAGQDNNSQGFRDNFTSIVVNFQAASTEITDLQNKAVVKSALSGVTIDNNMNNNTIYAVNLNDVTTSRVQVTTASGAVVLNYAAGQYQTVDPSAGSIILSFINWPLQSASQFGILRVAITVSSLAHTVTLPAAVSVGTTGVQGLSGSVLTFNSLGTFEFDFSTYDGGASITITDVNRANNVLVNPLFLTVSEDLTPSTAASLTKTTSYFTTDAAETATLAAGSEGQIKVFSAEDISSGNMVITVSNAGWKSSGTGTATFSARGASCILQYTHAKWFCIGNNGVTFA